MNFLAHLLLSCEQEELMIGNFLGDFVKNKELPQFSEAVQQGIRLHRLIDTFTDAHPLVRQGTKRIHHRHGKYAGVVIDVLYDYVLANHWTKFGPGSLEAFAQGAYRTLEKHLSIMPERLHSIVPRMIADDWLVRYGTLDGIAYTFSRIQKRVSRPEFLENILLTIKEEEAALTQEFTAFFPEIANEVKVFCAC
ncbi:MAG: ACP phosphodiesterase [Lewinella sp.]|uniref:acyl carrier protein phosphodiesterase n=1 Tax=Lewinella sp. TaxID=2004506 RepID=UPI003D6C1443